MDPLSLNLADFKSLGMSDFSARPGANTPAGVGRGLGSVLQSEGATGKANASETAAAFERMLVEMMMKSMRETVQTSDLFGKSLGGDNYTSFLDSMYVEMASQRGGFGMRETIERQLNAAAQGGAAQPNPTEKEDGANGVSR